MGYIRSPASVAVCLRQVARTGIGGGFRLYERFCRTAADALACAASRARHDAGRGVCTDPLIRQNKHLVLLHFGNTRNKIISKYGLFDLRFRWVTDECLSNSQRQRFLHRIWYRIVRRPLWGYRILNKTCLLPLLFAFEILNKPITVLLHHGEKSLLLVFAKKILILQGNINRRVSGSRHMDADIGQVQHVALRQRADPEAE